MKQLKKNLMFVGVAAFRLLMMAEAAQAYGPVRTAVRPPELATPAETAGVSLLRSAARRSSSARVVLREVETMQAELRLNVNSAKGMADVIAGIVVLRELSGADDLSSLPNEAQISSAMAEAADARFSLVSEALAFNSPLSLLEASNNVLQNNCDYALSKNPTNTDLRGLSVDKKLALSKASDNVADFVETLGFYGLGANSTLVSRNFLDLVHSGEAGQVDLDVALGLSAVFSGAGFGLINDRIKVMAVDGLDASEQAVIQQCSMAWGVEGLEASRGVDSSNRMAADVASACSVETSGVTLSASQIRSLCKI